MILGIDASRANEAKKTGTEWYAYHLIEQFKQLADPTDQFVLYSKEPLKGELGKLPPNFRNRVLSWPPRFLWTQLRLSIEMLFHAPDLLFVPAHTIPLVHPKRTVTTLHDIGFEKFHQLYSRKRIGYSRSLFKWLIGIGVKIFTFGRYSNNELDYHRWAARYAIKHAAHIITVSKFSKKEIQDIFHRKEEISVIYNGFDQKRYSKRYSENEVASVLERAHISPPYFLTIGRKEIKKNTLGLIQAYHRFLERQQRNLDSPRLVLIGKEGAGYDEIEAYVEQHRLRPFVLEPGWCSEEDIPILFQRASLFIFPSFYEGFGIPLLEAMASGVPVLASNASAIPEVAGEAALLWDPQDIDGLAKQMERLWVDESLRRSFIQRGKARVELFSWKECADRTLHLLKLFK